MKKSLMILAGASLLVGLVLYANQARRTPIPNGETAGGTVISDQEHSKTVLLVSNQVALNKLAKVLPAHGPSIATESESILNEAIDMMLSPQTRFDEKQAIWKRLMDRGQLDLAISEVEQRAAADLRAPEYPAFLGQAYFKKCSQITDVREQAVLAMKADQSLETALNLDPSNTEARFMRAVGLSYWPAQLNKGNEVIEQFQTLIQQQETKTPEPQYARSYVLLGEQYEKSRANDYATQVWLRGAAMFPNNAELKRKLGTPR